jgi:RNA polymerase sigma factor (sigma-70 family)
MFNTRQSLIVRVRDQYDDAAWEEFVAAYQGYVYVIIRRTGIGPEDAEDLRQRVMLKLWKKLPDFRYDDSRRFRSWLATVARNVVIDHVRAVRDVRPETIELAVIPEVETLAEREWERYLTNLALKRVADRFSEHARKVFSLSLDGLDTATIAEELDLKPNTVNQLRKRVRDRLTREIRLLRDSLE